MKKNPIPRDLLGRAIDLYRKYYSDNSDPCDLDDAHALSIQVGDVSGINWLCLEWLVCSFLPSHGGLKPDISNDEIYAILRLLGWEVTD